MSEGLGLGPERAAFEAWAKDQGFPLEQLDGMGDGVAYRDLRTHGAWEGFCVGIAAERKRIAAKLREMDAGEGLHNYYGHAAWVLFEKA